MDRSGLRLRLGIAVALFGASWPQPLVAQAGGSAEAVTAPPAQRLARHPYKGALGALANYRSCGIRVRAADARALAAELRAIEIVAEGKGLGPTLERLRQEYYQLRAISTMLACAGGPVAALRGARNAMRAFRIWAEAQPATAN